MHSNGVTIVHLSILAETVFLSETKVCIRNGSDDDSTNYNWASDDDDDFSMSVN